jgi:hypothetical protein
MGDFSAVHGIIVLVILLPPLIGIFGVGLQRKVLIKHRESGLMKYGYFGWSWTYYLFGWFVPIFRGEIGIGLLHLIISLFTFGLFQVIMSFLYNKQYMTRQLLNGWELADSEIVNQQARINLSITTL